MKFIFHDLKDMAEFINALSERAKERRAKLEQAKPNARKGREWHSLTAEMHAYWNASEIVNKAEFSVSDKESSS